MQSLTAAEFQRTNRKVIAFLVTWAVLVCIGAQTHLLAHLYRPLIGLIVAVTIVTPTFWYLRSSLLQRFAAQAGHRRIALFHTWRIAAAAMFFWYGSRGALPPQFWQHAAIGDLIAGIMAVIVAVGPQTRTRYLLFHLIGFADFVNAVGTGLAYTLHNAPRMAPIVSLPLALIPLFGVGISGATHLIAFHMLRKGVGLAQEKSVAPSNRGVQAV